MTLTQDQQKLVEENMGLVGKVIKDKVLTSSVDKMKQKRRITKGKLHL